MPSHSETVINLAQKCVAEVPVVVLGSGASLQYGVGGMKELADCLAANVKPADASEDETWSQFIAEIKTNGDLEGALHKISLPSSLKTRVVEVTRGMVLRDDQKVLRELAIGTTRLALSDMLRHLLRTANPKVSVVTTNYDRLAEYAADQAGIAHHTGFSHGYLRSFEEFPQPTKNSVEILKVHGSLDWFFDSNQQPVALPDWITPPNDFTPLMVTPGIGKYQETHEDPFRTIITRADAAFANASSILRASQEISVANYGGVFGLKV